jgi:hypothetical protein
MEKYSEFENVSVTLELPIKYVFAIKEALIEHSHQMQLRAENYELSLHNRIKAKKESELSSHIWKVIKIQQGWDE